MLLFDIVTSRIQEWQSERELSRAVERTRLIAEEEVLRLKIVKLKGDLHELRSAHRAERSVSWEARDLLSRNEQWLILCINDRIEKRNSIRKKLGLSLASFI